MRMDMRSKHACRHVRRHVCGNLTSHRTQSQHCAVTVPTVHAAIDNYGLYSYGLYSYGLYSCADCACLDLQGVVASREAIS